MVEYLAMPMGISSVVVLMSYKFIEFIQNIKLLAVFIFNAFPFISQWVWGRNVGVPTPQTLFTFQSVYFRCLSPYKKYLRSDGITNFVKTHPN